MRFEAILWDLDDDPDGNVQHCADHGVTQEEVEEVLESAKVPTSANRPSTGRPVVFGDTSSGRHLMVVFESVDAVTVYRSRPTKFPGGTADDPSADHPQPPPRS